jgi:hypothetical protein
MPTCNKCNLDKQLDEFYAKGTGFIYKTCKKCILEVNKLYRKKNNDYIYQKNQEWLKRNPDKKKQYRKKHYDSHRESIIKKHQDRTSTVKGHLQKLINLMKERKQLTCDQLFVLYENQKGKCAITGFEMTHIMRKGKIPTNISIDRIDSNKGYEIDNVRLVCSRANMMKGPFTDSELVDWCKAILSNKT